jgi:predicted N-acetyltransferase YhbS
MGVEEGASFRLATRKDIPEMAHVFSEAFKVPYGDEVILIYEASLDVQPDGCFVAQLDDEIVGTGCYFIYNETLAWIGNVAVLPAYQRKGIGTSIMKKLLKNLEARKIKSVRLDASEAGYPIYRKLGFLDEYRTVTYTLEIGNTSSAEPRVDIMIFKELND